jgi:hypothetical protein
MFKARLIIAAVAVGGRSKTLSRHLATCLRMLRRLARYRGNRSSRPTPSCPPGPSRVHPPRCEAFASLLLSFATLQVTDGPGSVRLGAGSGRSLAPGHRWRAHCAGSSPASRNPTGSRTWRRVDGRQPAVWISDDVRRAKVRTNPGRRSCTWPACTRRRDSDALTCPEQGVRPHARVDSRATRRICRGGVSTAGGASKGLAGVPVNLGGVLA